MNIFARSKKWSLLAILLLSLTITACGTYASHEWLEAPDWGRARLMDITKSAYPVVPAIDGQGNSYFALSQTEANVPRILVRAFDAELNPSWDHLIELERLNRANKPSIILTQRGVEVFWILNEGLYAALFSPDGEVLEQARRISGSRLVTHYDVAVNNQGERLLWFSGDRSAPGLFNVDDQGNISVVDFDGYKPQIAVGQDNTMYVSWLQSERDRVRNHIFLAAYPDSQFVEDQAQEIYTITMSITAGLTGPELGVDEGSLYIFWSEVSRTGLTAGQTDSYYLALPFGQVEDLNEEEIGFPFSYSLNYEDHQAHFQAGQRALPQSQRAFTVPTLGDITANQSQRSEGVIAFRAELPYLRNKFADQVGLVFLDSGEISGYQLLSFTPGISELPSIQADEEGFLYFTWLEQDVNDDFRVYFSTTRPETRAVLDTLTGEDALRITGNSLFGILSGMLLLPFPLLWSLAPIVIFLVLGFIRRENEAITAPGTLITLVLGLVAYTFAKLFTLPGILIYVPFSAWVPVIPEALSDPLRIGLPILIGLLALYVAYRRTYARENPAPLFFLAFFVMVDGFLTIAIYGVLFYGAV